MRSVGWRTPVFRYGKINTVLLCDVWSECRLSLDSSFSSPPSPSPQLRNKFIKKIPRDAEASNVLIGEVDFLDKPFVAFVRLAQATTLGGLTEVPVPTR